MPPRNPRLIEPDLRPPAEATVTPEARPVDHLFLANPPRFNPRLDDFVGLSQSLGHALSMIQGASNNKSLEEGMAEAQKRASEAQAGGDSLAQALAKLTNEDKLAEEHNPYFVTGYRRMLARMMHNDWYGQSLLALEEAPAAQADVENTGVVPEAKPDRMSVINKKYQEMLADVRKRNPALADDPWFQKESAHAYGKYSEELQRRATVAEGEALKAAHRNGLTAELSTKLDQWLALPLGSDDAKAGQAALNAWTDENVRRAGVKDPHQFIFSTIQARYYAVKEAQGAEAAREALMRMGDLKFAGVPVSRGVAGAQFGAMLATASHQVEAAADQKVRDRHGRLQTALDDFGQTEAAKRVWLAKTPDEALSIANELKGSIIADPKSFGIPPEFADEAATHLLGIATNAGKFTAGDSMKARSLALDHAFNGRFDEAELALQGVVGEDHVRTAQSIRALKNNALNYIDSNSDYRDFERSFRDEAATATPRNAKEAREYRQRVNSIISGTRASLNALLAAEPDETKKHAIIAEKLNELLPAAQAQLSELISPRQELLSKLSDEIGKRNALNQNAQDLIDAADLSAEDRAHFNQLNAQGTAQITAWGRINPSWKDLERDLVKTLTDEAAYTIQKGAAIGPFIDRKLVTAVVRAQTDPATGKNIAGSERVQVSLTAKGRDVVNDLVRQARQAHAKWFQSPAGLAARGQAGETLAGMAQQALDNLYNPAISALQDDTPLRTPSDFYGSLDGDVVLPDGKKPDEPKSEEPKPAGQKPEKEQGKTEPAPSGEERPAGIEHFAGIQRDYAAGTRWDRVPDFSTLDRLFPSKTDETFAASRGADRQVFAKAYGVFQAEELVAPAATGIGTRGIFWNNIPRALQGDAHGQASYYIHPYPMSIAVLERFQNNAKDAYKWREFADSTTKDVIGRIEQSTSLSANDKAEGFIAARTVLGIDYKELLNGNLAFPKGRGRPMPIPLGDNGGKIRYQVTPLFESEAELLKVAQDPKTIGRLFNVLKIKYRTDLPLDQQEVFTGFLASQQHAIRRINLASR